MIPKITRFAVGTALSAVLAGACLLASPAKAVPIVPGGFYVLTASTEYTYSPDPLLGTSGTDTFNFDFPGTFDGAFNSTTRIFVNPLNDFTHITVDWLEGAASLVGGPQSVPVFGLVLPLPDVTTSLATTYHLVIDWAKPQFAGTTRYETTLETGPGDITPPVPLPPAVFLFASALAGLGLLGRRRRLQRQA